MTRLLNQLWVDKAGLARLGERGTPERPFLDPIEAAQAAQPWDVIMLGNGLFDLRATLKLPDYVGLIGLGPNHSRLGGSFGESNTGRSSVILEPGNGCYIANIGIEDTNPPEDDTKIMIPIGNASRVGTPTKAVLRNVRTKSKRDGIVFEAGAANELDCYDCVFEGLADFLVLHGINGESTYRFHGGRIIGKGGPRFETKGIRAAGCKLVLNHFLIELENAYKKAVGIETTYPAPLDVRLLASHVFVNGTPSVSIDASRGEGYTVYGGFVDRNQIVGNVAFK